MAVPGLTDLSENMLHMLLTFLFPEQFLVQLDDHLAAVIERIAVRMNEWKHTTHVCIIQAQQVERLALTCRKISQDCQLPQQFARNFQLQAHCTVMLRGRNVIRSIAHDRPSWMMGYLEASWHHVPWGSRQRRRMFEDMRLLMAARTHGDTSRLLIYDEAHLEDIKDTPLGMVWELVDGRLMPV